MNGFCEKCELNASIKEEKNLLNNAIVEKNNNLLDENIIKISQYIDKMIYDCIKCKIRLVDINNEKVSLDLTYGQSLSILLNKLHNNFNFQLLCN